MRLKSNGIEMDIPARLRHSGGLFVSPQQIKRPACRQAGRYVEPKKMLIEK